MGQVSIYVNNDASGSLARFLELLILRFLENVRPARIVAGYAQGCKIPPSVLPKMHAVVGQRELHDAVIALGMPLDVLKMAKSRGWMIEAELLEPTGRRRRLYEILPVVLTARVCPRTEANEDFFPCSHYKQFNISDDTLRKAARQAWDPIAVEKRGGRNYYRDADVRRKWPHQFK
jgi:hypothetical protein